jgi:hypothetical protein
MHEPPHLGHLLEEITTWNKARATSAFNSHSFLPIRANEHLAFAFSSSVIVEVTSASFFTTEMLVGTGSSSGWTRDLFRFCGGMFEDKTALLLSNAPMPPSSICTASVCCACISLGGLAVVELAAVEDTAVKEKATHV